ncbi:FAD/NAD-P-binding domain-containing protein [Mycena belliarum]|uniref:FAD/NAD-P-binding domain-containing protein n=1 Tax=Mycena belliarum TaxID=1033014 RepID=A0AAD6TVY4_9AGAR|nr:FAD/NAD-P-binding domain-containing protein [Mycena belliae]
MASLRYIIPPTFHKHSPSMPLPSIPSHPSDPTSSRMTVDRYEIASSWLQRFSTFLSSCDAQRAAACLHEQGFLRDILTLTWSNRTLCGRAKIAAYLRASLHKSSIHDVKLDVQPHLTPEFTEATSTVASGFTFETAVGPGAGYFFLNPTASGDWYAMSVFITLQEIRGHEESGAEEGVYGGHTLSWTDIALERRLKIEQDPHVLIIGGGQTGLNIGARFKQMNISALIVEKNARVGDNWRERYPTLTLHSFKRQAELMYQPYPANWPVFTPRDKLAQWLEQYSQSDDLVVWTKSRPLPAPIYDPVSKRWTVIIDRDGRHVTIHPVHIVIAAGTLGAPLIPPVRDPERFRGITLHAGYYHGGAPFAGKRVIVVGAGNSAADICQDVTFHGGNVTMVQRSSTCVVSAANARRQMEQLWPANAPTAAGMKLNMGPDGSGAYPLMFERFGGLDEGKVKVKQGVEVARFTEHSVVFTDGSSLPADVVIYATSYQSIRDNMRALFSDEVIDQTDPLWGVDEEGEIRGCYRASGHPGLWFGAGNFAVSRFYSKQLALEIKAIELGLYKV